MLSPQGRPSRVKEVMPMSSSNGLMGITVEAVSL
jgi:hypothetical protein